MLGCPRDATGLCDGEDAAQVRHEGAKAGDRSGARPCVAEGVENQLHLRVVERGGYSVLSAASTPARAGAGSVRRDGRRFR